ncbi:MAG: hypothetical protein U1E32_02035 [Rhodoglobus sp.]|nr:hypothetical protein [Rhodoglobus sp.]
MSRAAPRSGGGSQSQAEANVHVAASGCSFDPVERRGIVAVTPRIGAESLGPLVLAVIHAPEEDVGATLARLDPALSVASAR